MKSFLEGIGCVYIGRGRGHMNGVIHDMIDVFQYFLAHIIIPCRAYIHIPMCIIICPFFFFYIH